MTLEMCYSASKHFSFTDSAQRSFLDSLKGFKDIPLQGSEHINLGISKNLGLDLSGIGHQGPARDTDPFPMDLNADPEACCKLGCVSRGGGRGLALEPREKFQC